MLGLFGNISPPDGISQYIANSDTKGGAIFLFISILLKFVGVIAGIYAVIQILLAGFTYVSSNGDPKKNEQAWAMIWQSLLGLLIVASAFTIGAVVGSIFKINILNPTIYEP